MHTITKPFEEYSKDHLLAAFKDSRKRAGLSREQLAKKMKVSASTIGRWERDGSMPMRVMAEWMEHCDSEINITFYGDKNCILPNTDLCVKCENNQICVSFKLIDLLPKGNEKPRIRMMFIHKLPQECLYITEQTLLHNEGEITT